MFLRAMRGGRRRGRGKLYGKFNIFSENVSRMLWIQWMFWLLHWFISRDDKGNPGRQVSGDRDSQKSVSAFRIGYPSGIPRARGLEAKWDSTLFVVLHNDVRWGFSQISSEQALVTKKSKLWHHKSTSVTSQKHILSWKYRNTLVKVLSTSSHAMLPSTHAAIPKPSSKLHNFYLAASPYGSASEITQQSAAPSGRSLCDHPPWTERVSTTTWVIDYCYEENRFKRLRVLLNQ